MADTKAPDLGKSAVSNSGIRTSSPPDIHGKLQTERTMLLRDDREDKRQAPGTKLYPLDRANSTESMIGMRRTLPSRALAYDVRDKDSK